MPTQPSRTTPPRRRLREDSPSSWFSPASEREHIRACNGEDLPDYCRNCRRPFMAHNNGACPRDS